MQYRLGKHQIHPHQPSFDEIHQCNSIGIMFVE